MKRIFNLRRLFDAVLDSRLPAIAPGTVTLQERLALVRQHGNFSLAYSTAVQPHLRYFHDEQGYIAYAKKMGHIFALGDPVAPVSQRADYIRRFVAACGKPCFVQITRETADVLHELGYRINPMGIETHIPLSATHFAGKKNETVRYSERWLYKANYSIIECDGAGADLEHLTSLSKIWRVERVASRREMQFLNRPFVAERNADIRRFLLLNPDGHAVAVLDLDPIFQGGDIIGYVTAFKRKFQGTTSHAEIGLTKFAADRLNEEGRTLLSFGLSPLAAITQSHFRQSRLRKQAFQRAFSSRWVNEKIFNLQGQAAFKRRFHGCETPTYMASKRAAMPEMIAFIRLLKLV